MGFRIDSPWIKLLSERVLLEFLDLFFITLPLYNWYIWDIKKLVNNVMKDQRRKHLNREHFGDENVLFFIVTFHLLILLM